MCKIKKLCKKGFTLLELLVVVLIIGILAAIALPQYQYAVDKTKFAKLQSSAKSIADAYQRYHLATNDYPNDMNVLDIDLPGDYTETNPIQDVNCRTYQDFYCCMLKPRLNGSYGDIICGQNDYSFVYHRRIFDHDESVVFEQHCRAKQDNKRAEKLCENFGKYIQGGAGIITPNGIASGYGIYLN